MDFASIDTWIAAYVTVPTPWPVAVGAAAVALLLGSVVYVLTFRGFKRFAASTHTQVDDLLVRRLAVPARVLVAVVALHVLLVLRGADHKGVLGGVIVVELLLVAYHLIETAETLVFHYWLGERQKLIVPAVVRHLVLIVLYTVVVLSILGTVTGLDLVPFLATSTVLTVVVGIALQDTLGNLFSGLALHGERTFQLGDWVLMDGIEGLVTHIGWRSTHLRTFNGDLVVLPNSTIARARIQNFYAPDRLCARNLDVCVAVRASPEEVERAVAQACANVALVRDEPAPKVWLVGFTPLFTRYTVKVWIDDFRVHDDVESDVMKAIWHALHHAGIEAGAAPPGLDGEGEVVAVVVR